MKYFIRLRGREDGPFSLDELRQLRALGRFSKIHEISVDRRHWERGATLTEIFASVRTRDTAEPSDEVTPSRPNRSESEDVVLVVDDHEEWHYSVDGQTYGPYPQDTMNGLFRSKRLPASTLVWTARINSWLPADHLPDFRVAIGAASRNSPGAPLAWLKSPATIAAFTGAAVLGVVVVSCVLIPWDKTKSGITVVRGHNDIDHLKGAVGRVFVGVQLRGNGKVKDIPFGSGTGFSVSHDGHFITNRHVIKGSEGEVDTVAKQIKKLAEENDLECDLMVWVFFGRNDSRVAEVIYISDEADLAILRLDSPSKSYLRVSAKLELQPSKQVFAVGFPAIAQESFDDTELAYKEAIARNASTISKQLVDKEFVFSHTAGSVRRSYAVEPRKDIWWIEHSADISQGNSGGPLIDENGVVVGINTLGIRKQAQLGEVYLSFTPASVRAEIDRIVSGVRWAQ